MKNIPLLMLVPFLMGCAANTGVVQIGQDTFMVSRQAATGFSGSCNLEAEAFREAHHPLVRKLHIYKIWKSGLKIGTYTGRPRMVGI